MAKKTCLVRLTSDTGELLDRLVREKGLYLSRFVEKVIDAYSKDQKTIGFLMSAPSICPTPFHNAFTTKTVFLDTDCWNALQTLKEVTGVPTQEIAGKIITHALIELQKGLPFGSTLKGGDNGS